MPGSLPMVPRVQASCKLRLLWLKPSHSWKWICLGSLGLSCLWRQHNLNVFRSVVSLPSDFLTVVVLDCFKFYSSFDSGSWGIVHISILFCVLHDDGLYCTVFACLRSGCILLTLVLGGYVITLISRLFVSLGCSYELTTVNCVFRVILVIGVEMRDWRD